MSLGRIVVSGLLLSLVPVSRIQACEPGYPVSYFPGGDDSYHRQYFPKTAVATNAVVKSCNDYYLTLHLGTELAMIGAHYYPAWTGKAPSDNPLSTSKADELDFFTAGAFAAVPKKTVVEDWRRFTAFDESVCRRLENGEKVDIPPGVPDYALEFYLYKLGHAQWLVFRKDEDPAPFGKLLTLPKRRRLYRTVWVHFVRIANARRAADKDRHIDALRRPGGPLPTPAVPDVPHGPGASRPHHVQSRFRHRRDRRICSRSTPSSESRSGVYRRCASRTRAISPMARRHTP